MVSVWSLALVGIMLALAGMIGGRFIASRLGCIALFLLGALLASWGVMREEKRRNAKQRGE